MGHTTSNVSLPEEGTRISGSHQVPGKAEARGHVKQNDETQPAKTRGQKIVYEK